MSISTQRITNGIQGQLDLHVFDIKASISADIGKRSWKDFLKLPKNIIPGLELHY